MTIARRSEPPSERATAPAGHSGIQRVSAAPRDKLTSVSSVGIIGAGPAGLFAANVLVRAGIDCERVFENSRWAACASRRIEEVGSWLGR
jgi:hypothetical protein